MLHSDFLGQAGAPSRGSAAHQLPVLGKQSKALANNGKDCGRPSGRAGEYRLWWNAAILSNDDLKVCADTFHALAEIVPVGRTNVNARLQLIRASACKV